MVAKSLDRYYISILIVEPTETFLKGGFPYLFCG
jgi:hypothetical protein